MKHFGLVGPAILIASCSPKMAEPPNNCAIPPPYYKRYGDPPSVSNGPIAVMPDYNVISVLRKGEGYIHMEYRDEAKWNGTPVSLSMIDSYLQSAREMEPRPSTIIDFPVGAPCKTVLEVRALMEKHLNCRNGYGCFQGVNPDWKRFKPPAPQPTPH